MPSEAKEKEPTSKLRLCMIALTEHFLNEKNSEVEERCVVSR
jgi:hypothetical protein